MKTCPQCSASYPEEYAVCPKDGTKLAGSGTWEPDSIIRGKYKILARIGEGGMAAVYRANHLLLDEVRALKVIKSDLARDEQFVRRFKNEAINTRKLQHPNAVRVDDLDIAEDGRPFIAMELVEGESLKARILRSGPLSISQTVDITIQVCAALEAAHTLGLVHRDIKPDNIVLLERPDATPVVKILDFGIARLKEAASGSGQSGMTLTGTGVVIGTPDYMSPEQAMGKRGEELDGRSDLYSLGIVMYRMLTGELPFKADTTVEMILHHIQTIPKPPHTLKPQLGIPDSISAIVMKVLEKDREKRFASAAVMAEALSKAQDGLTVAFRPPALTANLAQAAAPPSQPLSTKPASPPAAGSRAPVPAMPHGVVPGEVRPPIPAAVRAPSPKSTSAQASSPVAAKKEFYTRGTFWAALALALAIGWAMTLRRHKPDQNRQGSPGQAPASVTSPAEQPTGPAGTPASSSAPLPSSTVQPVATPSSSSSTPGYSAGGPGETRTPSDSLTSRPSATKPADTPGSSRVASRPNTETDNTTLVSPPSSTAKSNSKLAPWPSGVTQLSGPGPASPTSSNPGDTSNTTPSARGNRPGAPGSVKEGGEQEQVRQLNETAGEQMQQGDFEKAAETFRQVLQIAPNNPRAQTGLQRATGMITRQGGLGGRGVPGGPGQRRGSSPRKP